MAKQVIMPKFGFTQESATIIRWLKKQGENVEQGDPLLEVSTDKVDMEVEAPATGILDGIRFTAGETVPVTDVIAIIREPGEKPEAALSIQPAAVTPTTGAAPVEPLATPVAERMAERASVDLHKLSGTGARGRVTRRDVEDYLDSQRGDKPRATPAARRLVRELGVDLEAVRGTGPQGRVQSKDVELATADHSAPVGAAATTSDMSSLVRESPVLRSIPLIGLRKTIAGLMQSSWQAPHITFEVDVDVTLAEELRTKANAKLVEQKIHVTLTAIIAKICAWALRSHPMLNSRLQENNVLLLEDVNIGVAVAIDGGLIVPVVRAADQKDLAQVSKEISELVERARTNHLRPEDVRDGTFTISNLGMYGIDRFSAIINPPETAILAIGAVVRKPIVLEEDRIVVRPMLTLALSADHRVVDGALASQFLSDIKSGLLNPALLLI